MALLLRRTWLMCKTHFAASKPMPLVTAVTKIVFPEKVCVDGLGGYSLCCMTLEMTDIVLRVSSETAIRGMLSEADRGEPSNRARGAYAVRVVLKSWNGFEVSSWWSKEGTFADKMVENQRTLINIDLQVRQSYFSLHDSTWRLLIRGCRPTMVLAGTDSDYWTQTTEMCLEASTGRRSSHLPRIEPGTLSVPNKCELASPRLSRICIQTT